MSTYPEVASTWRTTLDEGVGWGEVGWGMSTYPQVASTWHTALDEGEHLQYVSICKEIYIYIYLSFFLSIYLSDLSILSMFGSYGLFSVTMLESFSHFTKQRPLLVREVLAVEVCEPTCTAENHLNFE